MLIGTRTNSTETEARLGSKVIKVSNWMVCRSCVNGNWENRTTVKKASAFACIPIYLRRAGRLENGRKKIKQDKDDNWNDK